MVEGLLSFLKTAEGQGLLSAGAGYMANASRTTPVNSIGRGALTGLLGYSNATARQDEQAERAKMGQFRDAQIAAFNAKAAAEADALARERAKRDALPGLFRPAGMSGGEAIPQQMGGVPMFSQPMGVSPMQATPGGFDVMGAIKAGFGADEIEKYAGLSNVGKPKATRQIEVDDGRGGKRIVLADDYGTEVGGFAGYTAPVQVSQGDRVSFIKPAPGVSLPVNMSPSERDASARGWAGNRLNAERLTFDKAGGADANKAPAGYRWNANRTAQEIIPGGPADLKASAEGQKRVSEANDVLSLLNQVEEILPKATGSYLGTGVDILGDAVGLSTEGAKAGAQLKAIQGALVSKMPKMSGPQSDKDVQLYREMAGRVGDPTIPVDQRQAAVDTIRSLNEKYAGLPEGSSKPQPAAAAAPKVNYVWKDGRLQPAR